MKLPLFETNRLILKEITLEDAPSYQKHFSHYEIIGHLAPHVPWPYPKDGAFQFIKNVVVPNLNKNFWMWGVYLKTQPQELIGAIDLYKNPTAADNRGFWLGQEFWRQGLMMEALKPITDFAFSDLGFTELRLSNALGNNSSRRIKEKQGAKLVGTREAKFINPDYTQAEDWILTKTAWQQQKNIE